MCPDTLSLCSEREHILYIVQYYWPEPYGPLSKLLYYTGNKISALLCIGNRVPLGHHHWVDNRALRFHFKLGFNSFSMKIGSFSTLIPFNNWYIKHRNYEGMLCKKINNVNACTPTHTQTQNMQSKGIFQMSYCFTNLLTDPEVKIIVNKRVSCQTNGFIVWCNAW